MWSLLTALTYLSCRTLQPFDAPAASGPAVPTPATKPSLLDRNTMVCFYGRALSVASSLGILGTFRDFDDMARQIEPYLHEIGASNGDKGLIPAVHLIYAMAVPCDRDGECLFYTEELEPNLVRDYIAATTARGWHLVLDTQIGRSDPVTQIKRLLDRGYLRHENVHVALDPEFSLVAGHDVPGLPIGTLDAADILRVEEMLDDLVKVEGLAHKKLLIVHQFGDPNIDNGVTSMIRNKRGLSTLPNVDLVVDADGFGTPDSKIRRYNKITDSKAYPFIERRGIKVFFPRAGSWGQWDRPPMDFETIFGRKPTAAGERVKSPPDVVIIS